MVQTPTNAVDKTSADNPQKVVAHLSHYTDDLHRCFMAFQIANLMQEHGATVTICLTWKASDLPNENSHSI